MAINGVDGNQDGIISRISQKAKAVAKKIECVWDPGVDGCFDPSAVHVKKDPPKVQAEPVKNADDIQNPVARSLLAHRRQMETGNID